MVFRQRRRRQERGKRGKKRVSGITLLFEEMEREAKALRIRCEDGWKRD